MKTHKISVKRSMLLICFIASFTMALAQDGLPPKPDKSKCYVKSVTKPVFKDTVIKIMVKPEWKRLEIIGTEYKTVYDTIISKEASVRYEFVPATYKTVYDTIIIKEGYNKLSIKKAEFESLTKSIITYPAFGRWEKAEASKYKSEDIINPQYNIIKVDPVIGNVICWKEYPELTINIPIENLLKNETKEAQFITPNYKVIKRLVIDKPAYCKEIKIPEETMVIKREVLVKDETVKEIKIPAEYINVKKTLLVSEGGMTIWKEIDCVITTPQILPIYFDFASAKLTAESKKIINEKIYSLMKDQPYLNIEISAYTDSRGSDERNLILSQLRAQSTVDYIVSKGISKDRLVAIGYGETRLKNECTNGVNCSEEKHLQNRRVEFRVIMD